MIVCKKCGSTDILQQVIVMADPNEKDPFTERKELNYAWDDFYWCNPCDEECHTKEVGNEPEPIEQWPCPGCKTILFVRNTCHVCGHP